MPFNQNPRFSNLPADSRWWANIHRDDADRKGLQNELRNHPLMGKMEISIDEVLKKPVTETTHLHRKGEPGVADFELKTFECDHEQAFTELMETTEGYAFSGLDHPELGCSKKLNELSFDIRSEPWWKTADKEEIASFISQKSLEYIENCDLPPSEHTRKYQHSYSLDQKSLSGIISVRKTHEKSFSNDTGTGLSKNELLEALCHSQTRAREAEKAAEEAYAEKEHLVKLLIKQASHLFAYKQWCKLLQLETLSLQHKKHRDPLKTTPPLTPCEVRRAGKKRQQVKRVKRRKSKLDVARYAVAFALGLSLVGAGLLLGWTVGWMVPF